jgi:hypothetical protein
MGTPKKTGGAIQRQPGSTAKLRRQEAVARLRLRHTTVLEIYEALKADPNFRNPKDGNPWAYETIARDVKQLDDWYTEQAQRHTLYYRGRQLGELFELRRAAWENGDLWLVLKTLEREARLLGTDEPTQQRTDLNVTGNGLPDVKRTVEIFLVAMRQEVAGAEDALLLEGASVDDNIIDAPVRR